MTDAILDEAYQRMHHAGPEWGEDRLTNHGPMAVETLVRRGYGDQVAGWVDHYLTRLDDLPGRTGAIDPANWAQALGQGRRIADWTAYFAGELDAAPWRDVLVRWWPRLLPGIVAGTTHGVIRVGHAVRALLTCPAEPTGPARTELAHALAFWAARFQGVPGAVAAAGRLDVPAALPGIPALADQDGLVASRLGRLPGTPAGPPGWPRCVHRPIRPGSPRCSPTWSPQARSDTYDTGTPPPCCWCTPPPRRTRCCTPCRHSPTCCGSPA